MSDRSSSALPPAFAAAAGRTSLYEHEAMAFASGAGLETPRMAFVSADEAVSSPEMLEGVPGDRLVVKLVADGVVHKSEVGGVVRVRRDPDAIGAAMAGMRARVPAAALRGFLVVEEVAWPRELARELLVSIRWTPDFGPVVALGPGGLDAEALAGPLGLTLASPDLPVEVAVEAFAGTPFGGLVTAPGRGRPPFLDRDAVARLFAGLFALAREVVPEPLAELELNPVVVTADGRLVALDAVARLGGPAREPAPRPSDTVARLLRPASIAVAGVSRNGLNPGRILLRNTLAAGFPRERLHVVHPAGGEIDGCRCWPALSALPEPVDLLVLAVAAAEVPALVAEAAAGGLARGLVVIPGGLGETPGSEGAAETIRATVAGARAAGSPIAVNGGNCLGLRSRPGRYDTLFIPRPKLPLGGEESGLAIVAGSGAFAIARASRLAGLDPRYVITVGNQLDLTLGDYLEHLVGDEEVKVVAVYAEGFRPGDGRRVLAAIRRFTRRGVPVVLYRAGRTAAGADASASHTAAVAGDAEVSIALARQAGALVSPTLEAMDDLVELFCRWRDRPGAGWRLGAMSNAGFECVAMADALGPFRLAALAPETAEAIRKVLADSRLDAIVGVQNPLDVTPVLGDAGFAAAAAAILGDPGLDVGLVGCVPLTAALATLPAGAREGEDLAHPEALAARLGALWRATGIPWVSVVDAGALYDPFAGVLAAAGIPVFRTADRALAAMAAVVGWRSRGSGGSG